MRQTNVRVVVVEGGGHWWGNENGEDEHAVVSKYSPTHPGHY